jgi:hypothetical protein
MRLQKRITMVMKFSSFLGVQEESTLLIIYWTSIPELERNIQLLLQEEIQESNEDLVAQELLRFLMQNFEMFKQKHLTAYLQEPCFFATQNIYDRLKQYWDLFTWQDYFQWANLLVSDPEKLLKKYNFNFKSKLTTYAKRKIESHLIDQVYQYMGWQRASDWGLLRKLSKKSRRKCLVMGGLTGISLEEHLLIWECFIMVYKPDSQRETKRLNPPSYQELQIMTQQYNHLAQKTNNLNSNIDLKEYENKLNTCIKKARNYSNPQVVVNWDKLDNLLDNNMEIKLAKQEENEEHNEVNEILTSAFAKLTIPQQVLFILWKGLQVTQKEIVTIMSSGYPNFVKEQFEVSRQVTQGRNFLQETLIEHYLGKEKQNLNPAKIKEIKTALNYWLEEHCQDYFFRKLTEIYYKFCPETQQTINYLFQQTTVDFNEKNTQQCIEKLTQSLQEQVQTELNLLFSDSEKVNHLFLNLIKRWLVYQLYL